MSGSDNQQQKKAKFSLGVVLITPTAIKKLEELSLSPFHFINRHLQGDWGDIQAAEVASNEVAMVLGPGNGRIWSGYCLVQCPESKLWIITEADWRHTTVLLPLDY